MSRVGDMFNDSSTADDCVDLERYRKLVKQFIDMRRYETALFWAEKVCVLSQYKTEDVYNQAQCLFLLKEYHRAEYIIRLHELEKTHIPSYSLLLESLYEAKQFDAALSIINTLDIDFLASSLVHQPFDLGGSDSNMELLASISYLKGKIYEAMDNRSLAMDYYVQALHKSVYCYEALHALVQHEMLMAWEEKELLQHLPLVQQSSEADAKIIAKLYQSKLKKYHESLFPMNESEKCPIGSDVKAVREVHKMIKKSLDDGYLKKDSLSKMLPTTVQTQFTTPTNKGPESWKNTPFSLQVSLSRASSLINESQRSHLETPVGQKLVKEINGEHFLPLEACFKRIMQSTDIMASEAEKLFYNCDYKRAMKILTQ